MTPRKSMSCLLLAAAALAAPAASAQEAPWKWRGALYAYLPEFGGSTTIPSGSQGSSITIDAGTIVDNLKFTFMGALEGSNGRHGMFTDVVYLNLGNTKSGYRELSLAAAPFRRT